MARRRQGVGGSVIRQLQLCQVGSGGNKEDDEVEEAAMKAMANILWQGRRVGGSGGNKEKEEPVAAGQEGGGFSKSNIIHISATEGFVFMPALP